ncbi:MAG: SEL1-like repeat protein [Proteobacteria bacterium]|nr:SEL1-like repeat protein [Pseudomonadota bacterium]
MQPDLPWNVVGIPPEAREAARAAARREGLSIGEWLTRRILRSFADNSDGLAAERKDNESWHQSAFKSVEEKLSAAAPASRETDEMLSRVSRAENESSDVYRRIEEQLRAVARRLDSNDRNQTENNRAMNKAAMEINVATREQAQAFDQLGSHVVGLADRLKRVEQHANTDTLREAVKGLHQGLSRLADQITDTTRQSATQISTLVDNVDAIAQKLADTQNGTHSLEDRVISLDERVRPVEKAGELLDRLASRFSANEAETAGAVAKLEETVAKLEARSTGNGAVERRLQGIEHTLSDIATRLDRAEHQSPANNPIEDILRTLSQQIEASEKRQREAVVELRGAMKDTAARIDALETKATAPQQTSSSTAQASNALFDLPSFPAEVPPAPAFNQPPPQAFNPQALNPQAFNQQSGFNPPNGFATQQAGSGFDMAPPPPPFDAPPPPFAADPALGGNPPFGAEAFAASAAQQAGAPAESYLEAARRSARDAAQNQRSARAPANNFTWGASGEQPLKPVVAAPKSRARFLLIGGIIFIALIAAVAGMMLSQGVTPERPNVAPTAITTKPDTARLSAPTMYEPNPTLPKANDGARNDVQANTQSDAGDESVVPPAAKPSQKTKAKTPPGSPVVVAQPLPTKSVPAQPKQTAAVSPVQRLTQLATNGDSKSQLVLGLKYLDGGGVSVNEAEAARWLERAANNGEPVAQYRLGTLYERGHGVPANEALAIKWYTAAANAGNRKAMHNLAVAFAEGSSGKKDYAEAAKWFTKAATLGLADSQFNLAVLYERGMGVQQSLINAYKWYAIAAVQGDNESKSRIEALSTQLSPADRNTAQSAADQFRPQPMDPNANVVPNAQ